MAEVFDSRLAIEVYLAAYHRAVVVRRLLSAFKTVQYSVQRCPKDLSINNIFIMLLELLQASYKNINLRSLAEFATNSRFCRNCA